MLHWALSALAASTLAAWTGLLLFRGRFWEAAVDRHIAAKPLAAELERAIRVEAVIPARDEASVISETLPSVLGQQFPGHFHVTLVDDQSNDGTADRARSALADPTLGERLDIVAARRLTDGWTGKLNALDSGVVSVRALRGAPDYWLFTDADIRHEPDNLARLVATAEDDGLALVSSMVRLHCATFWERLLIPAFVFFFQKLYPFAWANDPKCATAAAAGGCVLISDAALQKIGGLSAISDCLIDDCALAAAVKKSGCKIRIGLTDRAGSVRVYGSIGEIWSMVKRSAFTQLDYSWWKLVGTVLAMAFLYLLPLACIVLGVFGRDPLLAILGGAAWFFMALAYLPTLWVYRERPLMALTLPIAAALYTTMTVDSAFAHARGRGGSWKERTYGLESNVV